VGVLVDPDAEHLLRPYLREGGRQPHFGSEGDDLSLRIKKSLDRSAQEVPGPEGGSKHPDTRDLLVRTAQEAAEDVV
jgi:hypothetical protein